jgi:hypothetical protein
MSLFGRGGNGSGSDWYNTQRSEFLRQTLGKELKTHIKWHAGDEGRAPTADRTPLFSWFDDAARSPDGAAVCKLKPAQPMLKPPGFSA